jgi:hypothetical protein
MDAARPVVRRVDLVELAALDAIAPVGSGAAGWAAAHQVVAQRRLAPDEAQAYSPPSV